MKAIFENLKKNSGVVHCISNYVTANDMANTILASGMSPIMADDIEEVEEIVAIASSLLLNIGTLNTRTVDSMLLAGKKANTRGIPVVLDPVGVGASRFRQETIDRILREIDISLIKGNSSEIKNIYTKEFSKSGVDTAQGDIIREDNLESFIEIGRAVAKKYKTVVCITGPIDIVTDGDSLALVYNGNDYMEAITGTGCILGGLIAGVIGANPDKVFESTILGLLFMGIGGDYAKKYIEKNQLGTISFRTSLIDNISRMEYKNIEEDGRFEKR